MTKTHKYGDVTVVINNVERFDPKKWAAAFRPLLVAKAKQ